MKFTHEIVSLPLKKKPNQRVVTPFNDTRFHLSYTHAHAGLDVACFSVNGPNNTIRDHVHLYRRLLGERIVNPDLDYLTRAFHVLLALNDSRCSRLAPEVEPLSLIYANGRQCAGVLKATCKGMEYRYDYVLLPSHPIAFFDYMRHLVQSGYVSNSLASGISCIAYPEISVSGYHTPHLRLAGD